MNSEQCARPACPGKASAWLAYDYEARCAWLDDDPSDPADRSSRWPLCQRHADGLRVPRGWFSIDRRRAPGSGPVGPGGPDGDGPAPQGTSLTAIL